MVTKTRLRLGLWYLNKKNLCTFNLKSYPLPRGFPECYPQTHLNMSRSTSIKYLKAIVYAGIYGGLLIPLVFIPVVIFPFVFSKLIFFQILIGLTFPAYLILIWVEPQYRPKWVPLYSAIFAYFIALALSVIFAVDPLKAWWGNQERMNGLFTLLHFFIWFTMTTSFMTTWKQWRRILFYEVILSGVMAAVALLQVPFPKLLLFPVSARPGGLVDNPIYLAGYQIFNLFFIALLWLKGTSKRVKIGLIAFAALDLASFINAQSRGALVGLFAGVVIFAIVYLVTTPSKKVKIVVVSIAAAMFLLYGGIFALRNTSFVRHTPLERLTNVHATTETRFIAWKIGWEGFLDRPLTGWGLDDFHILFNQKYNPKSLEYSYYETWFDRAHNTVIDTLSMTGIIGFITFASIYIALLYSVVRAYRKKWIDIPMVGILLGLPTAYFVQNLFVFDQPAGFTMSFFMFALIAAVTSAKFVGVNEEDNTSKKPETTRSVPWIGYGVLMVLAAIIVWRTSILPWDASYDTIKSNTYFATRRYPKAFAFAQRAARIPTPYLSDQTFIQSRNLISLVNAGTIKKVPHWKDWYTLVKNVNTRYFVDHPRNTNPLFIYARFLNTFDRLIPADKMLAKKYYLRALATSPERQQVMYSLGRFYIENGKKQEGYNMFKKAVNADPNIGESHWYAGLSLMFDLGKTRDGAKEVIAAVHAPVPYKLKDVQEAGALAFAYDTMGDKAGLSSLLTKLQTLPGGSIPMYLNIARIMERQGLIKERNRILGALERAKPTLASRFAPLVAGSATSINESLKMTQSSGQGVASTATARSAPQASSTPSTTIVATTSAPESGNSILRVRK